MLCYNRKLVIPAEVQAFLPKCFGVAFFKVQSGAWACLPHVNSSLPGEMSHVWSNLCKHLAYLLREGLFHDCCEPKVRAQCSIRTQTGQVGDCSRPKRCGVIVVVF